MPFETLKTIMNGSQKIDNIKGKEYMMVKLISFGDLNKAERLNRYLFKVNQNIIDALIFFEGSELRRFPRWIRKDKKKNDLIDKLMVKYFERFGLEKRELENNYETLRKIVEDNLKTFLRELGEPEETFRKLGIELEKPKVKVGLERWFD